MIKRKTTVFIVIILAILFWQIAIKTSKYFEIRKGLDIVEEIGGKVLFATARGLYQLNPSKGKYILLSGAIKGTRHQDIAVNKNRVVYVDYGDNYQIKYKNKLSYCTGTEEKIIKIEGFDNPCALSKDNKVAFMSYKPIDSDRAILCIYNIEERNLDCFENISGVDSISWEDAENIFFGQQGAIYKLNTSNRELNKVTKGLYVQVLPNKMIGYWREIDNYLVCCKLDLRTMAEEKLFKTKYVFFGSAWDPSGRFVLVSTFASLHGLPVVWDTETGKRYRLPQTTGFMGGGFITESVYWVND